MENHSENVKTAGSHWLQWVKKNRATCYKSLRSSRINNAIIEASSRVSISQLRILLIEYQGVEKCKSMQRATKSLDRSMIDSVTGLFSSLLTCLSKTLNRCKLSLNGYANRLNCCKRGHLFFGGLKTPRSTVTKHLLFFFHWHSHWLEVTRGYEIYTWWLMQCSLDLMLIWMTFPVRKYFRFM